LLRVGIGYDLHRLVENRALVIGGVNIKYNSGLEGHSDADVLIHALIDALLGAAGLRDIGYHFPADDDSYRNISSLVLLKKVKKMLDLEGWKLGNTDAVIVAEAPVLAPYIDKMRENIAAIFDVSQSRISVKATTTEGLGVSGRREGIAAKAIVLIEKTAHPGPTGHEAE